MAEPTGGSGGSGGGSQVEGLIIAAQTQGVDETAKSLDNLGAVTIRSTTAIDRHSNAIKLSEEALSRLNPVVRTRIQALQAEWKAEQAATQAKQDALRVTQQRIEQGSQYETKLREMVATYNMTTAELQRYTAAQLGVSDGAEVHIAAMERMRAATIEYGVAIKSLDQIEEAHNARATASQISLSAQKARSLAEQAEMEASAMTALNAQRIRSLNEQATLEASAQASLNAQRIRSLNEQVAAEASAMTSLNAQRTRALNDQAAAEESARTALNAQRIRETNDQASKEESSRTALNAQRIRSLNEQAAAEKASLDEQQRSQTIFQAFKTRTLNDNAKEADRIRKEDELKAVQVAEKQAMEEIAWTQKSVKGRIDELVKLKAYMANDAIRPETTQNMFSSAALKDLPNLDKLIKEYNDSLGAHGKKLQDVSEKTSQWDKIMGNARIRTEGLVLVHEALQGRFTRLGGSLGVMVEYLSAANISVGTFAIGVMGTIGAVVGLTYEIGKGQAQFKQLANEVERTNGFAGESAGGFDALALSVGKAHGNFKEAYESINQLAGSGRFTSDQIRLISAATVDLNHVMGTDLNTTIKEFESLAVRSTANSARGNLEVAVSLEKLDQKYHFVNATLLQTIIELEKEGKTAEASQMAIHALADETKRAAEDSAGNIGYMEQMWNGVLGTIHQIIQGIADIGKTSLEVREQKIVEVLQAELPKDRNNPRGQIETDESKLTAGQIKLLHDYYDIEEKLDVQRKNTAARADERRTQSEADHALMERGIQDRTLLKKSANELEDALQRNAEQLTKITEANPSYLDDPKNQAYEDDRVEAIMKAHTKKAQAAKDDGRKYDLQAALNHETALYNMTEDAAKRQLQVIQTELKAGALAQEDAYQKAKAIRDQELVDAEKEEKAKLAIIDKYKPKSVADTRRVAGLRTGVEDDFARQKARLEQDQQKADQLNSIALVDKQVDAIDKLGQAQTKELDTAIKKQYEHNQAIGMTKSQVDNLRSAQEAGVAYELQSQADAIAALLQKNEVQSYTVEGVQEEGVARVNLDAQAQKIYEAELGRINKLIERRTALSQLQADGAILEAQAAAQKTVDTEWSRTNKKIGDDLVSTIVDGGGRGWKKLLRDMEIGFAKTVLQPILAPVSAGITSFLYPNATQAGGVAGANAGGTVGSYIGAASAAANLYKAASSGFSAIGSTMGQGVEWAGRQLGSTNMVSFGQGAQGMGADGSLGAMGSYGSTAGQIAGSVGGYFAGSALNSAISGQYSTGSGVMTAEKIATAVASYFNPVAGAVVGAISGLINRAFGMGPTQLKATGLKGTIADSGVSGQSYSSYHEDGGWFRSDKNWTDSKALSSDLVNSFTDGLAAMKSAVGGLAETVGVGNDALKGYSKSFDILIDPLKEVKGSAAEQAQITAENQKIAQGNAQKIADLFTTIGDDMAEKLVPNIKDFALLGETSTQTLQRLNDTFKQTNQIAGLLGKTVEQVFGSAGLGSDAVRERLLQLAGGSSNLSSYVSSYAQNYLTDAEKLAPVQKAVSAAMSELGLASVTTRQQFKDTVKALDLTKESDAKLFISLMQLQDAFATVTDPITAISDSMEAVTDAKNALTEAYKAETTAITQANDKLKSFIQSMKDMRSSALLGDKSPLTPEQKYTEARSQFDTVATAAKNGDADAQAKFEEAFGNFLDASRLVNASGDKYQQDFQYAMQVSRDAEEHASQQVTIGEATLKALNAQVKGLIDIDDSVKTVAQAIQDLAVAMGKAGQSTDAITQGSRNGIEALYETLLNRPADSGGMDYYLDSISKGSSMSDIAKDLAGSSEYKSNSIESLYKSLLNRPSDSAGMDFYLNTLNKGVSLDEIAKDMMASTEYQSSHSGSGLVSSQTPESPLVSQDLQLQYGSESKSTSDPGIVTAIQTLQASVDSLREEQQQQTGDVITATVKSNEENAQTIAEASRVTPYKTPSYRVSIE